MARLCAEYAGHPTLSFAYGPAGPQWVSDEAWRVLAGDAARRGLGLHFHLLESPAQAACARQLYPSGVLAHLERLGVFQAAASAAHFVHATERDIADAARLGIAIVTNPGSNMRLGNGPPPLDALHRAGVCIAIGSDNCTLQDDEDLLAELRLADALTRRGRADDVTGGMWMLDAATGAGTQAAFLNGAGAIAPGMKADLIALDLDPTQGAFLDPDMGLLDATMARAKGRDVTLTMVAGASFIIRPSFPALIWRKPPCRLPDGICVPISGTRHPSCSRRNRRNPTPSLHATSQDLTLLDGSAAVKRKRKGTCP